MTKPAPLTVGKLLELLGKLDPALPVFTHANNHDANDNMRVALEPDPWFRVDSSTDFGKPPTLGVRIGNFENRGQMIWDMWKQDSTTP